MSERNRFEIGPFGDIWYVLDHQTHEREYYPTKSLALAFAKTVAKAEKPSSLYIKNSKGEYQEERTYGGIDPFPPEG